MSASFEKSKKKINAFFSSFYLVSGLILFLIWAWKDFYLIHIGVLSTLSLIASYGLSRAKRWSIPLVSVVSLSILTLCTLTIYFLFMLSSNMSPSYIFIYISVSIYAILAVASLIHVLQERDEFR